MDFSLLAMKEAALRLGGKGIFIVADMTNIPLKENCVDGLISMHTLYHIPREEQNQAMDEIHRVLSTNGQAVVVYSWKNPSFMKLTFRLWNPVLRIYKYLKKQKRKKEAFNSAHKHPELFVQQQNYNWFANEVRKKFDVHLKVYSAISRSFSHTFIRGKAFGQQISSFIYWLEDTFPSLMGRWGQYPVFLLQKKEKTVPERKIFPAKEYYPHAKKDDKPAMVRQKKTGLPSSDKTYP